MKPTRTLALITPGAVSGTPFARFPGLAKLVTHVVAPTYREASRIANAMYFAHACRSLDEAKEVSTFLICDGARAGPFQYAIPTLRGRTVLLAIPQPEGVAIQMRERGARVALITVFDELTPCRFFVEGDREAAVHARKLFESARGEVALTVDGARPHLETARLLAGPILMGVLEGATLNLRRTGLSLDAIRDLLGKLAGLTLRVHQRSGSRTWRPVDTEQLTNLLAGLEAAGALAAHLRASESATSALLNPPRGDVP